MPLKTPSGWHDDAYRSRDHDHDELHLAVWRRLQKETGVPIIGWLRESVEFEFEFNAQERIYAFADLCVAYRYDYEDKVFYLDVIEVKPRIHSLGAVVRQCKALKTAIRACLSFEENRNFKLYRVMACVPATDPKLEDLRGVYPHVWGFDQ